MVLNFASIYMFFAPSFIVKEDDGSLFSNGIISGIASLSSILITYSILKRAKRRHSMAILLFIMILISTLISLVNLDHPVFKKIIYFSLRLAVSIMNNINYLMVYEIFPTQIRAAGSSFIIFFG